MANIVLPEHHLANNGVRQIKKQHCYYITSFRLVLRVCRPTGFWRNDVEPPDGQPLELPAAAGSCFLHGWAAVVALQ